MDAKWYRPMERIVVDGLVIEADRFLQGVKHDVDEGTLTLTLCNVRHLEVVYKDSLQRPASVPFQVSEEDGDSIRVSGSRMWAGQPSEPDGQKCSQCGGVDGQHHERQGVKCPLDPDNPEGLAGLRSALADAWSWGYTAGHSNAMRQMSDEPNAPTSPNPYRAGQ